MRVLVVGGTGIIGTGIVAAAYRKGYEIYAISRNQHPIDDNSEGIKRIKADWSKANEAKNAIGDLQFDVVVDGLVFDKRRLKRDMDLFEGRCKQYVYISTIGVYEQPGHCIDEDASKDKLEWIYSITKREAEKYIEKYKSKYSFGITIIRPPFTYGKTRIPCAYASRNNQWTLVERIIMGKPIVSVQNESAKHPITNMSIFSNAVVETFLNPETYGEAFHISDDIPYTWDDVLECVGTIVGVQPQIIHVPLDAFKELDIPLYNELRYNKFEELTLDNSKIKKIVKNASFCVELENGLKETVEFLEQNYSKRKQDQRYNDFSDLMILNCKSNLYGTEEKQIVETYIETMSSEYIDELRKKEKKYRIENIIKSSVKKLLRMF